MSNTLPDQWQNFVDNLGLPPGKAQAAFECGLAQLLIEVGEADSAELTLPRPDINPEQEEMVLAHLRWLLGWEATR
ncbi:MAG: hypothetical protein FOGNACKC_00786 [Anaerolineae bacterium]|nr:hypothetical protein [Anaerolineae bacterium]